MDTAFDIAIGSLPLCITIFLCAGMLGAEIRSATRKIESKKKGQSED